MIRTAKKNFQQSTLRILITVLLAIVICGSLITTQYFIYSSLTAYFLFSGAVGLSALLAGYVLFTSPGYNNLSIGLPVWLFCSFAIYSCANVFFTGIPLNLQQIYLVACSLLLFVTLIFFESPRYQAESVLILLTAFAILESVYCLCQYAGLFNSHNGYFKVSGTWSNPNVTAIFLAMAWPAAFWLTGASNGFKQKSALLSLLLIVAAVVLLRCRTAYLGITISSVVLLNTKYRLIERLRQLKRVQIIVISVLILALLGQLGDTLYQSKKASADGRRLIWKVSIEMIRHAPLTGIGYGNFERDYNLAQARYFQNGQTTAEKKTAGFVRMAYNDFLQAVVEGGLPALLLLCGLYISLLQFRRLGNGPDPVPTGLLVAYSGILAFAAMSVVNFTFQAIPAMAVALIYMGLLSGRSSYSLVLRNLFRKQLTGAALLIGGVCMCFMTVQRAKAHRNNKIAADIMRHTGPESAIVMMRSLASTLYNAESYWKNLGDAYLADQHFPEAIKAYNMAKTLSSNPEIYSRAGLCYELQGNYLLAEKDYSTASSIEPVRMLHRMTLMRLYMKAGQFHNARDIAIEVTTFEPKKISTKSILYKKEAAVILRRLAAMPVHKGALQNVSKPIRS